MLMDTCAVMPLVCDKQLHAYSSRMEGVLILNGGTYYINDVPQR